MNDLSSISGWCATTIHTVTRVTSNLAGHITHLRHSFALPCQMLATPVVNTFQALSKPASLQDAKVRALNTIHASCVASLQTELAGTASPLLYAVARCVQLLLSREGKIAQLPQQNAVLVFLKDTMPYLSQAADEKVQQWQPIPRGENATPTWQSDDHYEPLDDDSYMDFDPPADIHLPGGLKLTPFAGDKLVLGANQEITVLMPTCPKDLPVSLTAGNHTYIAPGVKGWQVETRLGDQLAWISNERTASQRKVIISLDIRETATPLPQVALFARPVSTPTPMPGASGQDMCPLPPVVTPQAGKPETAAPMPSDNNAQQIIAEPPALSWPDWWYSADQAFDHLLRQPQTWFGVMGSEDTTPSTRSGEIDSDEREAMRIAWALQQENRPTTVTTTTPAPPTWQLTWQKEGISFEQHDRVRLEDYALRTSLLPVNGTQYQPLAPGVSSGVFNIRAANASGSLRYEVRHQPLVLKEILPMALTEEGETPLEIKQDAHGNYRLAEDEPWLLQFLEKHYAATGRITGYTQNNGDGLVHKGNKTWVPVEGIPYPVRERNGKYYADAHPQKLPETATPRPPQRYKPLYLPELELVRGSDGQWRLNPTDAHQKEFFRWCGQRGLYGVTPLSVGDSDNLTPDTLWIAGQKIPFQRHVAALRVTMWPAIIDPQGKLPPMPVVWRQQQPAFTDKKNQETLPGHYTLVSAKPEPADRPSLTAREQFGVILRYLGHAMANPYETIDLTIRATIGDADSQQMLGHFLLTGDFPAPHTVRAWFAKVADIAFQFAFSSQGPEFAEFITFMQTAMSLSAKQLTQQNLNQQDTDALAQAITNMRRSTSHLEKPEEVDNFLRAMEQMFIEKNLPATAQPGLKNLFARSDTNALWIKNAENDPPLPVRQVADLYARKIPSGNSPEYYLSDGGRLRLMTPAERSLNARLEKVVSPGTDTPANLYRDINNDWLYVRLTDEQGIRTADIRVIKNDDWYEVPKFDASTGKPLLRVDQGFKLEGGKLVRLSVSELNARQPRAGQTYEKVYLSDDKDNQLITAYLPIGSAAQRKSGRNTYRYDSQSEGFIQTAQLIGPESQRFRLLGGVRVKRVRVFPPNVLQWFADQNIPEKNGRAEAVRQLLNRPLPEEVTREDVLTYFGVTEKSIDKAAMMAAVPDLNDNQKMQVEEKLPLRDQKGKRTSALTVAEFTFTNEKFLADLDISHAMLAKHYGYNKDVLINSRVVVKGKISTLSEQNITWLNSNLQKSSNKEEKVDHWDVAKLAVVHEQELTRRAITRPILANFYGMTESQLKTIIPLVRSENILKEMLNIKLPLKGTHIDDLAEFSYQESGFLYEHKINEPMQARFYGYDLKNLQEAKQRFRSKNFTPYEKIYFGRIMPTTMRREMGDIIQHLIQENYYLPSWPDTPFSVLGEYLHKSPATLQAALDITDFSLEGERATVLNNILEHETAIGLENIPHLPMSTLRAAQIYHRNRAVLNNKNIFQRHFVHKFHLDPHQFGYELLWQGTPPLHPIQQQFLAQFPLDANPQALATFYLRRCEAKEWPNITPAQLAREKNVALADVFDALMLADTPDLTKVQTAYLTPRLLESEDITRTEVVKFYLEKRDLPEWPKINLKQLAVRHKLNYGEMQKEKTRLTAKMTPEQVARVSELPLDDTLSVNKVAMLYRNNKHQPDWLDITPVQLAQYYGIDPVDLSIAINNLAVKTESLTATKSAIKLLVLDENGHITAEMDSPTPGVATMRNINNHLPIIRGLENHSESGTKAWLGIQHYSELEYKRVWWCDFNHYLNDLPKSIADNIKRNLKEQMIGWIKNESSQGDTLDANFKSEQSFIEDANGNIVYVGDNVIYTGKTVMPKNTFVGFFAAIGLTPQQILTGTRKTGHDLAAYHSWQVGNKKILSGYLSSNILAKMNTGQLGKQPAIGENNLVAVKFDNKLIGYVTVKDIHPGEPVYVKYGENFIDEDEIQVKNEPLAEEEPVASGSGIHR